MGVKGLTTYIANHSDRYLHNFMLHDTYLIVDGNCLTYLLYNTHSKCNPAFGGDYDVYAQCVSRFFDELLRCNVTPLVLFDGGFEYKKFTTILKRLKEKVNYAASCGALCKRSISPFPLCILDTFVDVLKDKGIKYAQCMFEADNVIAAVAKVLNCPVLSYDSDFYIYGSLYIPFDTMANNVVKNTSGKGYVKRCKIYRIENLLVTFKGLQYLQIPLAAIILGNDYVDCNTFRKFFDHIQLQTAKKYGCNTQQARIEATFNWLSRYSLHKAIAGIISEIPEKNRMKVLNIIEININSYTNVSADILKYLELPEVYVSRATTRSLKEILQLNKDHNRFIQTKEMSQEEESDSREEIEEDEEYASEIANMPRGKKCISDQMIINQMPSWFIDDFCMAILPRHFMDVLVHNLYICSPQLEDYSYPSSLIIGMKIVSAAYGLLTSGINVKQNYMEYIIRGENKTLVRCKLEPYRKYCIEKLPSVHCLRDSPMTIRRALLNQVLGVTDEHIIQQLPAEWMLYVATTKYWLQEQQKALRSSCSLYALLFSVLWHIIDSKIGYCRTLKAFHNKHDKKIQEIQHMRKQIDSRLQHITNITITEALRAVNVDDCLLAAQFFISHFMFDEKLNANPKKFNITVVHMFAEFQSCLKESMHLNALLGYPYKQSKIANMFNGTFLYNLYVNFSKRNNIDVYINTVLKESPSLLHLFNIFLREVKPLYETLLECSFTRSKMRRTKRKKKVQPKCEEEKPEVIVNDDQSFHDPSNVYSMLTHINQCD